MFGDPTRFNPGTSGGKAGMISAYDGKWVEWAKVRAGYKERDQQIAELTARLALVREAIDEGDR